MNTHIHELKLENKVIDVARTGELSNRLLVDSGPWYPPVPFYGNPSFRTW